MSSTNRFNSIMCSFTLYALCIMFILHCSIIFQFIFGAFFSLHFKLKKVGTFLLFGPFNLQIYCNNKSWDAKILLKIHCAYEFFVTKILCVFHLISFIIAPMFKYSDSLYHSTAPQLRIYKIYLKFITHKKW